MQNRCLVLGRCRAALGLDSRGRLPLRNLGRARTPVPTQDCSLLFQQSSYLLVAFFSGYHGWSFALVVGQLGIGAVLEQ